MRKAARRCWLVVAALAVCPSGCHENEPFETPDGDGDLDGDGDVDAGADAEADAPWDADADDRDAETSSPDADLPTGSGPVTHVVQSLAFVTDRMCDLDGNGTYDNALGDLGSPAADMLAITLNSIAQNFITEGGRLGLHLPLVADLERVDDPEVVSIIFEGIGLDDDPEDDFTGAEPFYVRGKSVDACGEPLFAFTPGSLEEGALGATGGALPLPLGSHLTIVGRGAELEGTIEPGLGAGSARLCAYVLARDLGSELPPVEAGDLTLLEVLLVGGAAWGLAGVPGLALDVDVDGDGLEQFLTDAVGHITACVDGDHTVIDGRSCWQDERIADAVSMTVRIETVSAELAGLEPGWELWTEGSCDGGPPEPSLWDPV